MIRINFGAGGNILEGWENHDAEVDITLPLPYPDDFADMCFAEHVGEHVTGPQLLGFLRECHRILKPGGVMRLCCPVVGPHLYRAHAADLITSHGHLVALNEDLMKTFLWCAGFEFYNIVKTERKDIDGHFRTIGIEKDDLETCRLEAKKEECFTHRQ